MKISQSGSSPITLRSGNTITIRTGKVAAAPAPQGGSSGGAGTALAGVAAGVSVGALITGVVAAGKVSDATDAATAATSAANAATSAANAAKAAADAAKASADAAGAASNQLATDLCNQQVIPSPGAASCG